MIASAAWPRENPERERLLWIDPDRNAVADCRIGDLPAIIRRGDLLVVNDAATLPASLRGLREDGTAFELRLLAHEGDGSTRWRAVVFGRGDWRQRTEDRPAPPRLLEGERVRVAGGVVARVLSLDVASPRLLRIAFEGTRHRCGERSTARAGPCSTRTSRPRSRSGTCSRRSRRARGPSSRRPRGDR